MLDFDDNCLVGELGSLPSSARIAFAAATAMRQLCNYERFNGDIQSRKRPREIAAELWADTQRSAVDRPAWSARLEEVMALMPEDDADWVGRALAEDALSSLAYAIRCLLDPVPQEAAWAARCAYEAADQAAIRLLGVQTALPNTEAEILSHELVQRELSRQRHDLILLRAGSFEEVKNKASENELLNEREAESLVSPS